MVNKKISELPAAATITGTEIVPLVQGGTTKAATVTQLLALVVASAPGNLDTFFEVATQMGLDEATVTTLQALVASKADAASVAATQAALAAQLTGTAAGLAIAFGS